MARLQLKERIEACMQSRCLPLTRNAEQVIEGENKRRQQFKGSFTTSAEEYMANKYSSVDSIATVMQAEECLKGCQKGRDVVAKVLE